MPLKVIRKEIEAEREIGCRYLQVLLRAEALVPGAGREAIDALLWDANAVIIRADVQNDRVVLDGTLTCQAVYRQGEELSLRALSAKSTISQVAEIPGARPGMLSRVQPVVENVEAGYENGHMVFQVSLGVHVRLLKLEPVEVIEDAEGEDGLEKRFCEFSLTRLAAEASQTEVLTQRVELPRALDARAALMDWGSVSIDSCEADLGGVRVKGRVQIETLIASGIEGRPAVLVKYPIEFDKLIELPEWLSKDAGVTPSIRSIRSQLEQTDEEEDGSLLLQADVHFSIAANLQENTRVLQDIYAVGGAGLETQSACIQACVQAECLHAQESVRGTVLLDAGAPAVGSVIAVRVLPNLAEIQPERNSARISGLLDASVLYMPVGSDAPVSAHASLPFELELPWQLSENPVLCLGVISAEANALMSDRLEMKILLGIDCEDRRQQKLCFVSDITEGERGERRPCYVVCWPMEGEDAWSIAKRYGVRADAVAPEGKIEPGEPLVLRI